MLAQEWTRPHGQRAGQRPTASAALIDTGQISGRTTGQRGGQGENIIPPL